VAGQITDLNPVSRITADAVGQPGNRTFFIQARKGRTLVTLLCEKSQVEGLSNALEQTLEQLKRRAPRGANFAKLDIDMSLEEPLEPEFRVGQIGLGYDEENDLVVIVASEILDESTKEEDARSVRFFCSRAQVDAFSRYALEVVSRGRPLCPLCGKPMDAEGNIEGFCPRRNGHADEIVYA